MLPDEHCSSQKTPLLTFRVKCILIPVGALNHKEIDEPVSKGSTLRQHTSRTVVPCLLSVAALLYFRLCLGPLQLDIAFQDDLDFDTESALAKTQTEILGIIAAGEG